MAQTILDQLAAHARERVAAAKANLPLARLREQALALPKGDFPFEAALGRPGLTFICEVKRASPSKGLIAPDFPFCEIAADYEAAGADCLSVLTEPKWFLGSDEIFRAIRAGCALPMLRKDFTVDEYQLYEAKALGADAALLICSLLGADELRRHLALCDALGLTALVEAHNEAEVAAAVEAGARVIGVNNRDLRTFSVDVRNAARLRGAVPEGVLYVAESGLASPADAAALRSIGADAALVGEYLMRRADRRAALAELRRVTR